MSATPAPEDGFRGLLPCFEGKPSRQRRCVKSSCVDIEVEARELALRQVLAACDKCGFPKIGDPYYKDPQMKVPLIFGRSPSSPPCGLAVKTPLQGTVLQPGRSRCLIGRNTFLFSTQVHELLLAEGAHLFKGFRTSPRLTVWITCKGFFWSPWDWRISSMYQRCIALPAS